MAPLHLAALEQPLAAVLRLWPTNEGMARGQQRPRRRHEVLQSALLEVGRARTPREYVGRHAQDFVRPRARVGIYGKGAPGDCDVVRDADRVPAADNREGHVGLGQLLWRQVLHERLHVHLAALLGGRSVSLEQLEVLEIPPRPVNCMCAWGDRMSGRGLHRSGSGG
jgi:hypothetical protein